MGSPVHHLAINERDDQPDFMLAQAGACVLVRLRGGDPARRDDGAA